MHRLSLIFVTLSASVVVLYGFETVIDYGMHKKALNQDVCDMQLKSLGNRMESILEEANANVPRAIYSTGQRKFTGNFIKCLSTADTIAGVKLVGKYCRVRANLPYPIQVTISNETRLQEKLYAQRRKSFKMYADYGCEYKGNSSLNTIAVKIDVCIPAACEVKQALAWVFNERITFDGELIPSAGYVEDFCRLQGDTPFSTAEVIALAIFMVLLLLTVLSTGYDCYSNLQGKNDTPDPLYSSFSIYSNTRRLVRYRSLPETVECADGIRVISLIMVILLHDALTVDDRSNMYLVSLIRWNDFELSTYSGTDAVDTFFVLSGLFLVYTTIDKFTFKSFIKNLHLFYVRRLLRLWPLMMVCVLISSSFLARVADGPNWNDVANIVNGCRLNWWSILLFIQNQVRFCAANTSICLGHFWYISLDMQLYVMSPLLLMCVFGHRRPAWIAFTLAGMLCVVSSAAFSFLLNFTYLGKTVDIYSSSRELLIYDRQYKTSYYMNPLTRAATFVIGMCAGYVLHCCRKTKLQIDKASLYICWILSLLVIVGIIGVKKPFRRTIVDQTLHNVMNGFSRTLWGLAIAWIVVACHSGYGGPVNWFLSLRIWKLPSRLSFAIYLVHFPIIYMTKALVTHVDIDAHINMISLLTIFAHSFVVAFVISVLVESPVQNLQKIYLHDKFKTVKAKDASKNTLELQLEMKACGGETRAENGQSPSTIS